MIENISKNSSKTLIADAIIAAIGDGISIQDTNFRILYQNKAHKDIIGDHEGEYCYEAYEQRGSICKDCPVVKALEDGCIHTSERSVHLKNGISHVATTASPLRDSKGEIIACIEVVRDITARKLAEEELMKHREHLSKLVEDKTSELISAIELLRDEINERRQAEAALKKGKHELSKRVNELNCLYSISKLVENPNTSIDQILQGTLDLIPPALQYPDIVCARIILDGQIFKTDNFKETPRKIKNNITVHDKQIGSLEVCYLKERPESHGGLLEGSFLKEEKDLINAIAKELGMTMERRWAETEALRSSHMASLGELAAGVAHEINNPINGIINYAQILANKSKPGSKEKDITRRIIKESERIASIVKGLLSFARASKEDKEPVYIHEIMSDALALIETQLKKDGIRLKVKIPPYLPKIIAQPQQIEQVFLNIISNARYALNIKYPEAINDKILEISGKKITIDNRPYIQIIFFDKGSGIASEIMDKIINPFFTTKPSGVGTGLGLSISHGIISDHGGRITIDSVEGEFTKVKIALPLKNINSSE